MNLKKLQLLQIYLLLISIINYLIMHLPYITILAIFIILAIVIYNITFYHEAVEGESLLDGNFRVNPLNINDDINLIPQELTQNVKYEVSTINTEINRTNAIVKSATLTISDSLKQLKEQSDNQKNMIETLIHSTNNITIEITNIFNRLNSFEVNTDPNTSDNMQASILKEFKENINLMTNRISTLYSQTEQSKKDLLDITQQQNDAVSTGIRALQFEDLTFQIHSAIKQNTQTIAELSNDIPVLCTHLTKNDLNSLITLKQKLIDINTESKQRSNNKSVIQNSIEEGDIELF